MAEDYFDEDGEEKPRERSSDSEKDSDYGQTFLGPKAAFAGKNLEVGAVHKVRIERILDSEIELRCIKSKSKDDEPKSNSDEMDEDEAEGLYD